MSEQCHTQRLVWGHRYLGKDQLFYTNLIVLYVKRLDNYTLRYIRSAIRPFLSIFT